MYPKSPFRVHIKKRVPEIAFSGTRLTFSFVDEKISFPNNTIFWVAVFFALKSDLY